MTAADILKQLKPLGTETYRHALRNHGISEPFYGVKIEDLKRFQKRIKKDYQLALDLYSTGVYDAMYLAGLIADETRMTRKDLQTWLDKAKCLPLVEYTVPWVASESPHGFELARKWIESSKEREAIAGWATWGGLLSITSDDELDLAELKRLLQRVEKTIHKQPDRVRYVMNGFVIGAGGYVKDLTKLALEVGKNVGTVEVDMNGTACKVPYAPEYIQKIQKRGSIGKKRKSARC